MLEIRLTGDQAGEYLEYIADKPGRELQETTEKLHEALAQIDTLQEQLNSKGTGLKLGGIAKAVKDAQKAKDISADAEANGGPKSPFKKNAAPEGVVVQCIEDKDLPLEPAVLVLIRSSVGKTGSRNTIKYLQSRSAKSMTTFRKTLKLMGLFAKGGYVVAKKD